MINNELQSIQKINEGWVKRIFLTSQLDRELKQSSHNPHLTYGNYSIWYDAIDQLLNSYQSNPTDLALEKDWQNLVGAKGVSLQLLPSIGDSYQADNPEGRRQKAEGRRQKIGNDFPLWGRQQG